MKSLQPYILSGLLALLSTLLLNTASIESNKNTNPYESYLNQAHKSGRFNGNALVLKGGEIAYVGSFGIGNFNPVDSLNRESVFRLGSVSKQFTAMGIIKLQEAGKLHYDQDIRDFIPELPYEGVTVRHLLHHVSGLPDYIRLMSRNWKSNLVYTDPARLISGNDDIIQMMAEKQPPIRFKPMQKWEYSNTGYVLLASIVSRASGMPFSKYLKEQIFDPVGMTNTVVYDYQAGPDSEMPNRVYGFRSNQHGSGLVSTDFHFLNLAEGDGGIYSTLDDLLKWDRVLYGNALISEASKKEAFTPVVLADGTLTSYGFGWNIGKSPSGRKVVEHGGSWVGFRTHIYREIEEDNCIILLTNNSSQHINTILTRLKKILHEQ